MSDPARLAELAAASDREFMRALLAYLTQPTESGAWLFRHEALRRRTRAAIAQLLQMADRKDRRGVDPETRRKWQTIRAAARREKEALQALPPAGAGPRRRALERLGQEYPEELAQLRAAAGNPRMRRSLLEKLAKKHPVRMIQLLREERARGDQHSSG